jgi:hypothetical protein
MKPVEQFKAFLQAPELSAVGSAQERAAFIAIRIDGRTIREVGQAIGVSKSQVTNLADLFEKKLATKVVELKTGSEEFRTLYKDLRDRLYQLQEESGSDRDEYDGDFYPSREDLAECFGSPSPRFDDE